MGARVEVITPAKMARQEMFRRGQQRQRQRQHQHQHLPLLLRLQLTAWWTDRASRDNKDFMVHSEPSDPPPCHRSVVASVRVRVQSEYRMREPTITGVGTRVVNLVRSG